jgi:hypothetical protein
MSRSISSGFEKVANAAVSTAANAAVPSDAVAVVVAVKIDSSPPMIISPDELVFIAAKFGESDDLVVRCMDQSYIDDYEKVRELFNLENKANMNITLIKQRRAICGTKCFVASFE